MSTTALVIALVTAAVLVYRTAVVIGRFVHNEPMPHYRATVPLMFVAAVVTLLR